MKRALRSKWYTGTMFQTFSNGMCLMSSRVWSQCVRAAPTPEVHFWTELRSVTHEDAWRCFCFLRVLNMWTCEVLVKHLQMSPLGWNQTYPTEAGKCTGKAASVPSLPVSTRLQSALLGEIQRASSCKQKSDPHVQGLGSPPRRPDTWSCLALGKELIWCLTKALLSWQCTSGASAGSAAPPSHSPSRSLFGVNERLSISSENPLRYTNDRAGDSLQVLNYNSQHLERIMEIVHFVYDYLHYCKGAHLEDDTMYLHCFLRWGAMSTQLWV